MIGDRTMDDRTACDKGVDAVCAFTAGAIPSAGVCYLAAEYGQYVFCCAAAGPMPLWAVITMSVAGGLFGGASVSAHTTNSGFVSNCYKKYNLFGASSTANTSPNIATAATPLKNETRVVH